MTTVAELVALARNPSASIASQQAAFGELVVRFQEFAFHSALRLIRNPEDARDAAQEAFLLAWQRLGQLRQPAAFGVWLQRLIRTSCNRQSRRGRDRDTLPQLAPDAQQCIDRETDAIVSAAVARLPEQKRRVVILFYYLGYTLNEIAKRLALSRGSVGKLLYSARLEIRRAAPRWLRAAVLPIQSSSDFARRVRAGIFDEFVGQYRFERRPDLFVTVARERDCLVSYGSGQRHILASLGDGRLATREYDGEGRFRRDRRGRITGFVYYEFGKRLGVAAKIAQCAP